MDAEQTDEQSKAEMFPRIWETLEMQSRLICVYFELPGIKKENEMEQIFESRERERERERASERAQDSLDMKGN